jgi:DNA-binding response OmpR family regulator
VKTILLATDADEVFDEVDAALANASTEIHRVRAGKQVRSAAAELDPDLVILDMQIGNMGGPATCLDLRLEEGADRLDQQRVLLLLDRADDVFIARRSGADHWITKPLDALKLRNGAEVARAGGPGPEPEPDLLDDESPTLDDESAALAEEAPAELA